MLNCCPVWLDHSNAQVSWKYGTARAGLIVAHKKCEFCMFFLHKMAVSPSSLYSGGPISSSEAMSYVKCTIPLKTIWIKMLVQNPAYRRHWISWCVRIVAPIPKRTETDREGRRRTKSCVTYKVSFHISCVTGRNTLVNQKSPVHREVGFLLWHWQRHTGITEIVT